jgi:maltose/moltooligosaccharide transporter
MSNSSASTAPLAGVKPKPRLSLAQIFFMSFGFLGIQFGFALQNGNTSYILQSFGANVDELPLFWVVAPLVGMIVQPIIGHYSDKTWTRLGRRKPYFLFGAIFSALALVFLPNSGAMASILPALWIGAGIVMIMDVSFNVSMEPFRALVADNLPDEQRTSGFAIQTFLIGGGAVVGSALPDWLAKLGVSSETIKDKIGDNFFYKIADNIKYSFYIGAAVFIIAILITVFFSKEYSPKEIAEFQGDKNIEEESKAKFSDIFKDFISMPKTMKQLGLVQFFTWFALFSMWVFTDDAVATHIFDLKGDYTKTPEGAIAHNVFVSSFGVYNLVAAVYALCLPIVAKFLGRKGTHAFSLFAGGIGLVSIYFITDPAMLTYSMIGVGLAWASILAMPYVILSGSIPAGKLGIYMGIFNFFITLPQIVNGICGGWIVKHIYGGHTIYAVVFAGILLICAAVSVLFVYDPGASKLASK